MTLAAKFLNTLQAVFLVSSLQSVYAGMKTELFFRVPNANNNNMKPHVYFKAPTAAAATVKSTVAVEYARPAFATFGRVASGLVLGLFYVLIAVDGLSIALFGLASFLGLVLKLAGWFLGVS